MDIRAECWLVTPLASPRPRRNCPRCRDIRPFVCAETFRVNAQKKVIDVWLNYRCDRCHEVWKCPVLERVPVACVAADWMDAFLRSDPVMVRRWAFDIKHLVRHTARLEASAAVQVERVPKTLCNTRAPLSIRLDVPLPCAIRLDRLLAGELGVPRSDLPGLYERGALRVFPANRKPLSARIHDGQRLWLLPA